MRISIDKKTRSYELFLRSNASFSKFVENWRYFYGEESHLNRKALYRLHVKFKATGSLENKKRKAVRPVRNEDIIIDVAAYFELYSGITTRRFFEVESLPLSLSTLYRILRDDLKLKPFKSRRFHRLHGQKDFNERYHMCKMVLDYVSNDPFFLSRILWTDECFLKLNGTMNHHNIRWWASENPHRYLEKSLNAAGVMVFVGISTYGPIGPFFFDDLEVNSKKSKQSKNSASGLSYHELLTSKVFPEINSIFPKELLDQLIFQLDGAPGHKAANVVKLLNKTFRRRWWGNNGPLHWAPRSPDLTPLGKLCVHFIVCIFLFKIPIDFSFWGCLRDKIYRRKPVTISQLKDFIKEEISTFSLEYYKKICLDQVLFRIEECRKNNGQLIEPFFS